MKTEWTMALLLMLAVESTAAVINVSSYGAFPDDGTDDTAAINSAVAAALPGDTVSFASGVYDLKTAYDQYRYIYVNGETDVTLQGAVDAGGDPATTLLRHVAVTNMASPPRTINVKNGSGVAFKNFTVDNTPRLCTSGEITEVDPSGTYVKVRIFSGLPMDDGAACYSANAWEPDTLDLKEVESLTFTESPANWSLIDPTNRIMKLENGAGLDFLDKVEVGEYMSWHYGWNGQSQIRVDGSQDLTLENLSIPNIINMGILIGSTDGITLRDITMRSSDSQLMVGPRDGIHISRCPGAIVAEGLDITGVRWDGFVVHAPYAEISTNSSSTELTIAMLMNTAGQSISSGSRLWFLDSAGETFERTVSSASYVETVDGKSYYDVILSSDLPAFAGIGTYLKVEDMRPSSVSLTDSHFENVAGSSLILLTDNVTVSNTTHRNIIYSAAHIGANNSAGSAGENIQILDSVFDACGWAAKSSPGVITVENLHLTVTNGIVQDVLIRDNLFINQLYNSGDPTIYVADTDGITIQSNVFENVWRAMKFDNTTTSGYQVSGNTVIIDNDGNDQTYTEVSGSFGNSSLTGYDGSATRYSGTFGAETAWEFIVPKSGDYAVYIYKVVHSTSDTNALIEVDNDAATAAHSVDYTAGGSGWHYLGTYSYTGGQYTVSNQRQGGYLRADAVKFVQQAGGATNPPAAYVVADFNDMERGAMIPSSQPAGTGQGFSSDHWESGTSVMTVTLGDLYAWTNTQYGVVQSGEGRCVRTTSEHDRRQARSLVPVSGTDTNIWFSFLVRCMDPTDVAGIDFKESTSYYLATSRQIQLHGQTLEVDGFATDVSSKSFYGENTLIVGKLVLGAEPDPEALSVWINPVLSSQVDLEATTPDFYDADMGWNISQLEVLGICSYDTQAESSDGGMLDAIRLSNGADAFDFIKQTAGTLPANEISRIPMDLHTPLMTNAAPAPGQRVKATLPAYAGTDVYHALYLPTDWEAGGNYPVIVEYAGNGPYINKYGDTSAGTVEGSNLGYGISGGEGFIWVCMPFVSADLSENEISWWGDIDASVEYCKDAVADICQNYGGDSNAVFLAGFSRGAIACNYIGLHDDSIAALWKGFIVHSHYDGVKEDWPYPEADRASAAIRLARLGDRPQFISQENTVSATQSYLQDACPDGDFTFQVIPYRNHQDTWPLRESPERTAVRQWLVEAAGIQPSLQMQTGAAGGGMQFSWPDSVGEYVIQGASELAPVTSWTAVTNPVVLSNGIYRVWMPFEGTNRFFRLLWP